jgi:hypothetical protein
MHPGQISAEHGIRLAALVWMMLYPAPADKPKNPMRRKPYMPKTTDGIGQMLVAFDTNINANAKALAIKYNVADADLTRISQAAMVWQWFMQALSSARVWSRSLTETRDRMVAAAQNGTQPLPGGPMLPAVPDLPGPPPSPAQLEPGFFTFFTGLVAQIKNADNYDVADGQLLGIEGAEMQPPDPATTIPHLTGEIFTSGQPEISCTKGVFQGFDVLLTRPGQARKVIGFSNGRRFNVPEPLPAPGMAEVWKFEAQYRYQDQPFGQISQPLNLTVWGV